MDYNYRDAMTCATVRKIGRLYYIEGLEDSKDDGMNKRQLFILMHKLFGTEAEEIAFFLLELKENPEFTQGFFGVNGYFLFAK